MATTEVFGKIRNTTASADAFSNIMARLGYGSPHLLESTSYPLTRLTRNYILMQSLYRTNWIARKVIDAVAEDMLKNWVEVTSQESPEKLDDFKKAIRVTRTRTSILQGLKWGRLFGGAAAVMMIEGQEDILDEPLDYDSVELDSYKGLLVLDRWSGITPAVERVTDIDDPIEFGLPVSYRVTTSNAEHFEVHHSRVLRFVPRTLPEWECQAEQQWGLSEIELLWDELRKHDNTSWNIASLIFRANIFAMRSENLAQMLSTGTAALQQRLSSVLSSQNWLMSNQGLMVLPEEGGLENHSYSFGGISDVYLTFMMDLCGACEIPMTRLFGRTQTGLGQSNEGDERIYYDTVAQKQEEQLRPVLDKLFKVVSMSTWGEIPDDFSYTFKPIRDADNQERADLAEQTTRAILGAFNTGAIGRKTALKELREQSTMTGMFTNVTDDMIDEADDDVDLVSASEQQAWEMPQPLSRQAQYQTKLRRAGQTTGQGGGKPKPAATR